MGAPLLTAIPDSFVAGTTVKWTSTFGDYPAPTWSAMLHLAGSTVPAPIAATPSGASHAFAIAASISSKFGPGTYRYEIRVTSGGETYVAESGVVEVARNIASATAGSELSRAQAWLPILDAAIEGRLGADVQDYMIAGRMVKKIPIAELLQIRAWCVNMIEQEKAPGTFMRDVNVVFNRRV